MENVRRENAGKVIRTHRSLDDTIVIWDLVRIYWIQESPGQWMGFEIRQEAPHLSMLGAFPGACATRGIK